jgi:hypothetical protein
VEIIILLKVIRRFSVLAMSNNINQQNFNIQDLVGATNTGNTSNVQVIVVAVDPMELEEIIQQIIF